METMSCFCSAIVSPRLSWKMDVKPEMEGKREKDDVEFTEVGFGRILSVGFLRRIVLYFSQFDLRNAEHF